MLARALWTYCFATLVLEVRSSSFESSRNEITSLEAIMCLPKLEILELGHNRLANATAIQSQTKYCPSLKQVVVNDNPCAAQWRALGSALDPRIRLEVLETADPQPEVLLQTDPDEYG